MQDRLSRSVAKRSPLGLVRLASCVVCSVVVFCRRWVGSWVEERASGGGQSRFKTPLPPRQRPSCERNPHLAQLGRWPLARVAFCGGCSSALLGLRTPLRPFRETGATRAARPPKEKRGDFLPSKLGEKLPRFSYRLRRALPPYPMRGTMSRTINRPRGLRLSAPAILAPSRINEDAAGRPERARESFPA